MDNKYKRNGTKQYFSFRQVVLILGKLPSNPTLFDHLDNDANLQHAGIILEPSIGWEGKVKDSTSATSQTLLEAKQKKTFTK